MIRIPVVLTGLLLAAAAVVPPARADVAAEPLGVIERLPETYPDHWMLVHDISFFHMSEGEIIVVDPLAATQPEQYKGMLTASFMGAYQRSGSRGEQYVIETFTSRGTRGGERTDVVTIYDHATLKMLAEVIIPPKRMSGMPKPIGTGLSADERFLMVYNFTPAQSVSIVDLERREFVAEVPTPGCGMVVPTGQHSFMSLCSNGTLRSSRLDGAGRLIDSQQSERLFDPDVDPLFEAAGIVDGIAYFPTFQGRVLPVDLRSDTPVPGDYWWLTTPAERSWRPAGIRPIIVDAEGTGYVLMQPDGKEGSHKDGGSEVWAFDLESGQRTSRLVLRNWGITLGTSGSGDRRLLAVTNPDMKVDIYRLPAGDFVHTLSIEAQTPLVVHGAH